jgi:RNA polymerase sigma factor (sigma-70 family)
MPSRALTAVVEYIRQTAGQGRVAELTDGQLLERFVADRDENAFGALVQRHGALVLSVCRRVLDNTHDVEDAFQATFLVLVRKAGSIAKRESVSSWLHGVARRTAVRAKMDAARQDMLKRQVQKTAAPECMQEIILQDLRLILDEEVQRLPERAPLDTDGVAMHRFRTDPTVVPKVAYVGIEVVNPEAHKIQARLAAEQARSAGIEVLPYPEIGKVYDFALSTEDGRKIRANDLTGKVVLLDFWTCG